MGLKEVYIVGSLCLVFQGFAENNKVCFAKRVVEAIRMDARLDEAAWSEASIVKDFVQYFPKLGQPSKKLTEVRLLYDNQFLYIGARMHHGPDKADVIRQVHRRDQSSVCDWFAVYLDSVRDRRSALIFAVNASNVQRDGVLLEDNSEDYSWDGVWESAVSDDEGGWTAELKIPLSLLRFSGAQKQVWGINFMRRDEGVNREYSNLFPKMREDTAWLAGFPNLEGLEGLQPQMRRELAPYVSVQRKFETTERFDDRKWQCRVGVDAHLGLNDYSQLDLTVHPDFGQVEVDQEVINLTTIETQLPEKRPFFLEGMDIFRVPGADLFYSRRLGRGLGHLPSDPTTGGLPEDAAVVDFPKAVEIIAAGKYTAKMPGGLAVGLLGARMGSAQCKLMGVDGQITTQELPYRPYTSAAVVRATQTLDQTGSYLGMFGSHCREASTPARTAFVRAIDGCWKSKGRRVTLGALYSRSDSYFLAYDTKATGHYFKLRTSLALGRGWSLDGSAFDVSKTYSHNALGYLDRPDKKGYLFELRKNWDEEVGIFRNPALMMSYNDEKDQAGRSFKKVADCWMKCEFNNEFSAYLGCQRTGVVHDDRELRTFYDAEKKYLKIPGYSCVYFGVNSPTNWKYAVKTTFSRSWRERGIEEEYSLSQSFKPLSNIELAWDISYNPWEGQWFWLETQEDGTPVVGLRSYKSLDSTLRLSYAYSPNLTFQCFNQWLMGTWRFQDLQRYIDENTLLPGATPHYPVTSSERLWNFNLIARWEFRPGSSLYLVYTHGVYTDVLVSDNASIRPWKDLTGLRHAPSDDTVQVKVSWLFR